jgi:glycerol 3-phosphatase-2
MAATSASAVGTTSPPQVAVPGLRPALRRSVGALCSSYDVALLDLDGVVYVGSDAVPGAPAALEGARAAGMGLAFVTNNAARSPEVVAEHLAGLGIPAEPREVTTSAQAAAHYLAERFPPGARMLVLGADGLIEALVERGLTPVFRVDDEPVAVVQGFSPYLDWKMLAQGSIAIRGGLMWVATNTDATVPSPHGPLPGNGSLVAALRHATGQSPISTGKPDPVMHLESMQRSGARNPLVVGDRLDTDIQGAAAAGCHSMLVLSGVTTTARLLAAEPGQRPDYVAADVGGLLVAHLAPLSQGGPVLCGSWAAEPGPHRLLLRYLGNDRTPSSAEDLDAVRALCVAAWQQNHTKVHAGDEHADATLDRLSLR